MTAATPRIAFIGLGLMGAGFTKRLTGLGYSVMVLDLERDRMAAASSWRGGIRGEPGGSRKGCGYRLGLCA